MDYTKTRVGFNEACNIFPHDEIISILTENIRAATSTLQQLGRAQKQYARDVSSVPDDEKWFYQFLQEEIAERIKEQRRKIARFETRRTLLQQPSRRHNSYDIEGIKEQVPIDTFLESGRSQQGNRRFYPCPIHNEKTPSFCWYLDNNSWYCFGCHEGGSVIDLYMKLHDVDAKKAIQELNKLL